MSYVGYVNSSAPQPVSPLMLSDRFLRLAEETDSAGFRAIAENLIALADQVLEAPDLSPGSSPSFG